MASVFNKIQTALDIRCRENDPPAAKFHAEADRPGLLQPNRCRPAGDASSSNHSVNRPRMEERLRKFFC